MLLIRTVFFCVLFLLAGCSGSAADSDFSPGFHIPATRVRVSVMDGNYEGTFTPVPTQSGKRIAKCAADNSQAIFFVRIQNTGESPITQLSNSPGNGLTAHPVYSDSILESI